MPHRIPSQDGAASWNASAEALRASASQVAFTSASPSTSQPPWAPSSQGSAAFSELSSFRATHVPASAYRPDGLLPAPTLTAHAGQSSDTASTVAALSTLSALSASAPARSSRRPAGRARDLAGTSRIKTNFEPLLADFAAGTSLAALDKQLGGGSHFFGDYFCSDGSLNSRGTAIFGRLGGRQQAQVRAAMMARQANQRLRQEQSELGILAQEGTQEFSDDPVAQQFFQALIPYAEGLALAECGRLSGLLSTQSYLTPDGRLTEKGEKMRARLPASVRAQADVLLARRRDASQAQPDLAPAQRSDRNAVVQAFMAMLPAYAEGRPVMECARRASLKDGSKYLGAQSALKDKGEALYRKLDATQKAQVDEALAQRRARIAAGTSNAASASRASVAPTQAAVHAEAPPMAAALSTLSSSSARAPARSSRGSAGVAGKVAGRSRIRTNFEPLLADFAAGASLTALDGRLETGSYFFQRYFCTDGTLSGRGKTALARMAPGQQAQVQAAITARQANLALREEEAAQRILAQEGVEALSGDPVAREFLEALEPYAQGLSLAECERLSGLRSTSTYLTRDGRLTQVGETVRARLPASARTQADALLAQRRDVFQMQPSLARAQRSDSDTVRQAFLAALPAYAEGQPVARCALSAGLKDGSKYLGAQGALKEFGRALYDKLDATQKAQVDQALERRRVVVAAGTSNAARTSRAFPAPTQAAVHAEVPLMVAASPSSAFFAGASQEIGARWGGMLRGGPLSPDASAGSTAAWGGARFEAPSPSSDFFAGVSEEIGAPWGGAPDRREVPGSPEEISSRRP